MINITFSFTLSPPLGITSKDYPTVLHALFVKKYSSVPQLDSQSSDSQSSNSHSCSVLTKTVSSQSVTFNG